MSALRSSPCSFLELAWGRSTTSRATASTSEARAVDSSPPTLLVSPLKCATSWSSTISGAFSSEKCAVSR